MWSVHGAQNPNTDVLKGDTRKGLGTTSQRNNTRKFPRIKGYESGLKVPPTTQHKEQETLWRFRTPDRKKENLNLPGRKCRSEGLGIQNGSETGHFLLEARHRAAGPSKLGEEMIPDLENLTQVLGVKEERLSDVKNLKKATCHVPFLRECSTRREKQRGRPGIPKIRFPTESQREVLGPPGGKCSGLGSSSGSGDQKGCVWKLVDHLLAELYSCQSWDGHKWRFFYHGLMSPWSTPRELSVNEKENCLIVHSVSVYKTIVRQTSEYWSVWGCSGKPGEGK